MINLHILDHTYILLMLAIKVNGARIQLAIGWLNFAITIQNYK